MVARRAGRKVRSEPFDNRRFRDIYAHTLCPDTRRHSSCARVCGRRVHRRKRRRARSEAAGVGSFLFDVAVFEVEDAATRLFVEVVLKLAPRAEIVATATAMDRRAFFGAVRDLQRDGAATLAIQLVVKPLDHARSQSQVRRSGQPCVMGTVRARTEEHFRPFVVWHGGRRPTRPIILPPGGRAMMSLLVRPRPRLPTQFFALIWCGTGRAVARPATARPAAPASPFLGSTRLPHIALL